MGNGPRDGRRAVARAAFFIIPVLAISLFVGRQPGHAADLRIVSGIVTSVSATELDVDGRPYVIARVPVRTARREPVLPTELSPGTKVDLYFRGEKLLLVHVYPNIAE